MIKDTKVVDLMAWKRRKEEEELDALRAKVNEMIEEYSEELEPQMYPSVYTDASLGTIDWLNLFGLNYTGYDSKVNTGLNTHADIVLEPTKESCTRTLAWVSYVLSDMGMTEASNMVEDVIRHIDNEDA